ncbi:hypothetical protein ACLOJK_039946 [Asimina triloba]
MPKGGNPKPLRVRVLQAELLWVKDLAKVYAKTEKEIIEEQVHVRDRHKKVREANELQIKAVEALSREEARRVGMKISPIKDLKTMLIEAEDDQILEVVLLEAAGMQKLRVTDHMKTLTDWSNKEIFKWSYDVEAQTLKILEYLLHVESRVIPKNAALNLEPELDNEGMGTAKQKLQEWLLDAWRELRNLE